MIGFSGDADTFDRLLKESERESGFRRSACEVK
jgi:hypothetical protein